MSSFIDRLHEQTAAPALLWLHGDDEGNTVRWVGGNPAVTVNVRGIFYADETKRDEARGIDIVTTGILEVAGTLTAAENDKWSIDGAVYKVLAIGTVAGGLKPIHLQRIEQKVRRAQRDVI